MSQSAIGPAIRAIRKEKGISQNQLAKKAGISQSGLSSIENTTKNPSIQTIKLICEALDVSPEIFFYDNDSHLQGKPLPQADAPLDGSACVYPVTARITAGSASPRFEEEPGAYEQIPLSWLRGHAPEEFFVLRVMGDSMYPRFIDGDRVLVLRTRAAGSGAIGVVLYDAEAAVLRRVCYESDEDWMQLEPLNPEYAPKRIAGEDRRQCRILGEVWRLIRIVSE